MLNGDAHLSEIEGELRFASDPLPYQRPAEIYHRGVTWAFWSLSAGTSAAGAVPQAPATHSGDARPRMYGHVRGLAFCVS